MTDKSIKGKSPILRNLKELKALVTGTRKVWPLTEEKKKKLEEEYKEKQITYGTKKKGKN